MLAVRDSCPETMLTKWCRRSSRHPYRSRTRRRKMDTGIWASGYDVDEEAREGFHDWLHGTYLPFLKTLPGVAWVAHYAERGGGPGMKQVGSQVPRAPADIGDATQFVVLVGAATPQVFFNPLIFDIEKLPEFRDQLAKRKGLRSAIFSEQTRVNGPSAHLRTPGTTPGPAIQMGAFTMASLEQEI